MDLGVLNKKRKPPRDYKSHGAVKLWQRPTLARPIDTLPLAMSRFTSGFEMGPGGTTTLRSPDHCSARGYFPFRKRTSSDLAYLPLSKNPVGILWQLRSDRSTSAETLETSFSDSLRIKNSVNCPPAARFRYRNRTASRKILRSSLLGN